MKKIYTLATVIFSLGTFSFFGFQVTPDENFEILIDADHKMEALKPIEITRQQRKEIELDLNFLVWKTFRSVNGLIGLLSTAASPVCANYSSFLQRKGSSPKVKHFISQIHVIKLIP